MFIIFFGALSVFKKEPKSRKIKKIKKIIGTKIAVMDLIGQIPTTKKI
jgi:hypothetical protein